MARSHSPRARARIEADADQRFRIHLLNVNRSKYGDAIVLELGPHRVLIDCAHPGDDRKRAGEPPSIPEQLQEILQQPPPFALDALIVTHTHSDHIGCLPAMVERGLLRVEWALVADEELGWGEVASDALERGGPVAAALAGIREEAPQLTSDAALAAFLADAAGMKERYTEALDSLAAAGTRVIRYRRAEAANIDAFRDLWASRGLHLLGPSFDFVEACGGLLDQLGRDALPVLQDALAQDSQRSAVALYRLLTSSTAVDAGILGADGSRVGNAINCQSLVLVAERAGKRVLLTGDMQLANPYFQELRDGVKRLRGEIAKHAPYDMVKLAHHGARNGFDEELLAETRTRLLTISTGPGSADHPNRNTLEILARREEKDGLVWLRTDRNGAIRVDYSNGAGELSIETGDANDLTPPQGPRAPDTAPAHPLPELASGGAVSTAPAAGGRAEPPGSGSPESTLASSTTAEAIEVVTRIPRERVRVTLRIDVEPLPARDPAGTTPAAAVHTQAGQPDRTDQPTGGGPPRLAAGRQLPRLLFATDTTALATAVGQQSAVAAVAMIQAAGHDLVSGNWAQDDPMSVAAQVVQNARQLNAAGIVLLGGYEVIPPAPVDVYRPEYGFARTKDADAFLVWSDNFYGCLNGDGIPEIPVSRVPDGGHGGFLLRALSAPLSRNPGSRAGLRNQLRPFAAGVYAGFPGNGQLLVSAPVEGTGIPNGAFGATGIYLMLHGDHLTPNALTGETTSSLSTPAFDTRNVNDCSGAVVLSGCCWGALTVDRLAYQPPPFRPHTDTTCLSLRFLAHGANAFVGCTGAHYSPMDAPYAYAGGPLQEAFVRALFRGGLSPAAALCRAKQEFAQGIPHLPPGAVSRADYLAVDRKLLVQFSCLGLGW